MFDPATFLNTNYEEKGSTTYTPVPESEYVAVSIGEVKARQGEKDGNTYTMADINWEIDSSRYPEVANITGREKNVVRQTVFLDLTPAGHLDMGKGKNVQLNRVREAVGQNEDGRPWNFNMLIGQAGKVLVKHKPDSRDGSPQAFVAGVTKIS